MLLHHYIKVLAILLLIISFHQLKAQKSEHQPIKYASRPSSDDNYVNTPDANGIYRCSTTEYNRELRQEYPQRQTVEEFEKWIQPQVEAYKKQASQNNYRAPIITIPCVFHIITDGAGAENISAAQVQAQIDQLNIDFRDLAGSTDAARADVEIEFCLATLDPSDNLMAEPGINRVTTFGGGQFTRAFIDGTIKAATSWDPDNYMNVWVADIGGGLLGWAQFPDAPGLAGVGASTDPANRDGVVHLYSTIGSVANPFPGGAPYNLGRTMTHEVGHWLGLRHIWGDGGCGVDDFCADTPESDDSNGGCPNHTSCGTPDMVENYMDYTNDACMDIFTADQKARIRTVMSTCPRRASLASSTKCGVPTPYIGFVIPGSTTITEGTDCSYQEITLDVNISMAPSADAVVTFGLDGTSTATGGGVDLEFIPNSVTFLAGQTNNQQVTVRIYNDGQIEPDEFALINMSLATAGDALISTGDPADHQIDISDDDRAISPSSLVTILDVDFESGGGGFTVAGNGGSDNFRLGTNATLNSANWSTNGNASTFAFTNDDNCNCDKNNDRITSPVFSLVGAYSSASLSFDHAFADLGAETGTVQISTGGAWTNIATLTNTSIDNGGGNYTTPWVVGTTVDLTPYIGQATVQIRFRYRDGGGWLYGMGVDNILITGGSSTEIQTVVNTAVPRNSPVGGMQTINFFDPTTDNVMGSIQNTSAWDYQCTRVEVDRDATTAGAVTSAFWNTTPANYLLSKTFYIDPANNTPTGTYSVTFYFTDAEITAWETATGQSRNNIQIVKVQNTTISTITPANYNSYNIEVVNPTRNAFGADLSLTATFSTGFSGFGVGVPGPVPASLLSLELLSFEGQKIEKDIQLDWATRNEVNVHQFQLNHSLDGITFEVLNTQNPNGNNLKNNINTYGYLHKNAPAGINYYRLNEIDLDGKITYSKTIAIEVEAAAKANISIAPNPVRNNMNISYDTPQEGEINIEVYNIIGKKLLSQNNFAVMQGNNAILLDTQNYPAGVYILKIKQGEFANTKRFIKK